MEINYAAFVLWNAIIYFFPCFFRCSFNICFLKICWSASVNLLKTYRNNPGYKRKYNETEADVKSEWDSEPVCEREKQTAFFQMTAVWGQCVLSFIIWSACLLEYTRRNSHSETGEPRWEEAFYYPVKTTKTCSAQDNVTDTHLGYTQNRCKHNSQWTDKYTIWMMCACTHACMFVPIKTLEW